MKTEALLQSPTPQSSVAKDSLTAMSALLESFPDGIIVLTPTGTCLHINRQGRYLCRRLEPQGNLPHTFPREIRNLCDHLIESRELLPENRLVLSHTVTSLDGCMIALRVQWIEFGEEDTPALLVTLEDRTQTTRFTALLESLQFKLTPRETEVWLLRKANYSYDAIATQLFIATNTVKRHLKNIYAKRKQALEPTLDEAEAWAHKIR